MINKMKFNDFIRLNRGFDLPESQIESGEYPVVASTNIKAYHKQYKVDGPAVVTGRSGSLGKVQYVEGKCWPLNTSLYVKDFKGNYPKYVYYYLQIMHLEQFNSGAGVPTLNQNHLHSMKVLVHDIQEQKNVANILSAYDDLIENNNKRIKILEQMAENLYKEWFVRFRFPGHETAEFENGIPKGWEIVKLNAVFDIKYGKDHKNLEDGIIPVFGSGGIMRYGNKALHSGETVLIPRKGSLNNVMYYNGPLWTVDTMFYTDLKMKHIAKYAYFTLSKVDMESLNTGASIPSMSTDVLYHLKMRIPKSDILEQFDKKIELLFQQQEILKKSNDNLIRQRDLLLPRLMSGKLSV